jgi:hypothetical protein
MRGQYNLSFHHQKEEMQKNNLHEGRSQPTKQLDRVIEQISRLMLRSAQEAVSKEKLNKGEPAIILGKKKKKEKEKQQQQQNRGAGRHLQEKIWDPGGFQYNWRAHE